MTTDWMSLFLSALVGACVGWAFCSIWSLRWIDRERRRMRDDMQIITEQARAQARELQRLQTREKFNRERA